MLLGQLLREMSLGWGGIIQAQFYWLDKDGKHFKVTHHEGFARTRSGIPPEKDYGHESYKWMYANGWARITIEDHSIYVNTQYSQQQTVKLSRKQKEWLQFMRDEIYPAMKLEIQDIYGKKLDI